MRMAGIEDEHGAERDQQDLGEEVDDGEQDVEPGRLLDADDVDDREHGDDQRAADDVAGGRTQRLPEQPADVVRHEERRDGDRDDVVEHLAPRGEEGPELVERAPRERGRAAGLRVHRRGFRVRGGGAVEEEAGDDEDHRRQTERVGRDESERVVDRGADVAVGGGEERVDAQHALEALQSPPCHATRACPAPAAPGAGAVKAPSRSDAAVQRFREDGRRSGLRSVDDRPALPHPASVSLARGSPAPWASWRRRRCCSCPWATSRNRSRSVSSTSSACCSSPSSGARRSGSA